MMGICLSFALGELAALIHPKMMNPLLIVSIHFPLLLFYRGEPEAISLV